VVLFLVTGVNLSGNCTWVVCEYPGCSDESIASVTEVAEDNGVVIHTPPALTHTFLPCRPATQKLGDSMDPPPSQSKCLFVTYLSARAQPVVACPLAAEVTPL